MTRALVVPVVIIIVAATGCATQGAVTSLRSDLSQLRAEFADARAAQECAARDIARVDAELQALDAHTPELAGSLRQTVDEVALLGKRLEAAEEAVRMSEARIAALAMPPAAPLVELPPREPLAGRPEQTYAAALAAFRTGEHGPSGTRVPRLPGAVPETPARRERAVLGR